MEQARYASRLRYLDAQDVDDSYVDFDGLDVRGRDNEKLGDTEGFILNADSGRVLYVVVDSGGWFTSRRCTCRRRIDQSSFQPPTASRRFTTLLSKPIWTKSRER